MNPKSEKPIFRRLFFLVILGIGLGIFLGVVSPTTAVACKPLGDGFIKLIKMIIPPIIFCTIVSGFAGMGSMKKVGRVGAKALLVFEINTTLALLLGLIVVDIFKPGSDLHIDMEQFASKSIPKKMGPVSGHSVSEFFLNMIPSTLVSAFSEGEILQVLLISILFASALASLGDKGRIVVLAIESLSSVLFKMVELITLASPIGAFGAMAFTVGKYGVGPLKDLGQLILIFYLTCLIFILLVLFPLMRYYCQLSPWQFLRYLREELLIVLGTSSSETVLPQLMEKLEAMGCSKPVVGLVIPTGYSFNLDGSSIYFTVAAMFITYATQTSIHFWQELSLLGILLITSKGAAGVTGSGFLVLAATLTSMKWIPQENLEVGLALIFAIDRFMSTGRAIVNLIGNAMTTVIIATWEKEIKRDQAIAVLGGQKGNDSRTLSKADESLGISE